MARSSPPQKLADPVSRMFPRTLFVLDNLCISGAEKVAINLMRHAQSRDEPVSGFVCLDDLVGAERCGATIHALGGPFGGSFPRRLLRAFWRLPALCRAARGCAVLVAVTPPAIPWALIAGWVAGARVVPWIHYDLEGFELDRFARGDRLRDALMNGLHTWLVPRFRRLIFVSTGVRDSFARHLPAVPPEWHCLPNPYDPVPLTAGSSRCASALAASRRSGRLALLFAGRISRQKQWEEALAVARLLFTRAVPFDLHIAGDGPEMAELQAAVNASPAKAFLYVHGFDADIPEALRHADALILTSRHEAWPTTILEAFDTGTPVFAYDCPSGPATMLGSQGERGVLCKDAGAMADALSCWLHPARAELRQRMTRNAHSFLDQYRPDATLSAWAHTLMALGHARHDRRS